MFDSKTKNLGKISIIPAVLCGCMLSVLIGMGTYRQAKPNFNSRDAIRAAKKTIMETRPDAIGEPRAIGLELSEYNKKVANSMFLTKYSMADLNKLTDPELMALKEHFRETALKPFAVQEYGIIAAAAVGVLSSALTISICWLLIFFILYAIRTAIRSETSHGT